MDEQQNEATMRLAAERGQADAVEVMLELGADVNAADPAGRTALHLAAAQGYRHVIEQLLERGADASLTDAAGRTARELAEQGGFPEAAAALDGER